MCLQGIGDALSSVVSTVFGNSAPSIPAPPKPKNPQAPQTPKQADGNVSRRQKQRKGAPSGYAATLLTGSKGVPNSSLNLGGNTLLGD